MIIGDEIKDEKSNKILAEKQQKYQHYHHVKLRNMNILQVNKILLSEQSRVIDEAKFTYSPFKLKL